MQIGKSWIIRHFGETYFKGNYCEINFEKLQDIEQVIEKDLDAKKIT
jgi:hypothetical protein